MIDVTGSGTCINNVPITFNGPSNAYFVLNVNCEIHDNVGMTLENGVTANNILWNLTDTTGDALQTSGASGAAIYGTYLATDGGQIDYEGNTPLSGALIETDGTLGIISNATIAASDEFMVPGSPTPEPASLSLMLGAGLLLAAGFARKRFTRA